MPMPSNETLKSRYPLLFKSRDLPAVPTLRFGFECGDGWAGVLDALCASLYSPYAMAVDDYKRLREREGQPPAWKGSKVVSAVDVERARLAMLEAELALPMVVQIKEKFGGLRFYADNCDERADALIEMAQRMAARTCEACGAPGELREGGWLRTLCDTHAAPAKQG